METLTCLMFFLCLASQFDACVLIVLLYMYFVNSWILSVDIVCRVPGEEEAYITLLSWILIVAVQIYC